MSSLVSRRWPLLVGVLTAGAAIFAIAKIPPQALFRFSPFITSIMADPLSSLSDNALNTRKRPASSIPQPASKKLILPKKRQSPSTVPDGLGPKKNTRSISSTSINSKSTRMISPSGRPVAKSTSRIVSREALSNTTNGTINGTRKIPLPVNPVVQTKHPRMQGAIESPTSDARVMSPGRRWQPSWSPLQQSVASPWDGSFSSALRGLSLLSDSHRHGSVGPETPSRLPRPATPALSLCSASVEKPRSCRKSPPKVKHFLTRDSTLEAFDHNAQIQQSDSMFQQFRDCLATTQESLALTRENQRSQEARAVSLQKANADLRQANVKLNRENTVLGTQNSILEERIARSKLENEERITRSLQENEERLAHIKQQNEERINGIVHENEKLLQYQVSELELSKSRLKELESILSDAKIREMNLEAAKAALHTTIDFLQSGGKAQAESYATLEKQLFESQLRQQNAESLNRKLHNQIQELKGNIRVFCRVRATTDPSSGLAEISFPDAGDLSQKILLQGPLEKSVLGKDISKTESFEFDRVYGPTSTNHEIFIDVSELIKSATDGYNVCVFAYGQTGSGKTYTMSSEDGMIPRALRQIYSTVALLREVGWSYTMEGSFVEIYNETIIDLLVSTNDQNANHEVRHENNDTSITGVVPQILDSQEKVESILAQAMAKRSVAATKANEHSSRSHAIFILKINGTNHTTGETSKGVLNLVDLAGSERLAHSKAEGARLKETKSINKSLSCLGDVISALGQGRDAHIPYRNSKLTYLLQNSLGGNSKTLMFVNISPFSTALQETLTSLRFATKVNSTHIGVSKKIK